MSKEFLIKPAFICPNTTTHRIADSCVFRGALMESSLCCALSDIIWIKKLWHRKLTTYTSVRVISWKRFFPSASGRKMQHLLVLEWDCKRCRLLFWERLGSTSGMLSVVTRCFICLPKTEGLFLIPRRRHFHNTCTLKIRTKRRVFVIPQFRYCKDWNTALKLAHVKIFPLWEVFSLMYWTLESSTEKND